MPRCKSVAVTLDHAAPAEVARQVLRGDALEAGHPALEAALVGVDVLDVIAADGPLTFRLLLAGNRRDMLSQVDTIRQPFETNTVPAQRGTP